MTAFHYGHYVLALTLIALANFQWGNSAAAWTSGAIAVILAADDMYRVTK